MGTVTEVADRGIENHAYHRGIDVHGNAMTAGEYLLTRVGDAPRTVFVTEDEVSGDLSFLITIVGQQIHQRVEECASDVAFMRVD